MAEKFNAQSSELDASPGTVAVANQTVEGVFAGQSLHYTAYVVQKKNTLATVAALFKTTAGNLISLNLQTADVFPAGSALYLFGADTNYLLQAGDTFSIVTSSYNISIDELGARNAGASLLAMNQSADKQFLAIPDAVQLPSAPKTPYYSSYLAKGGGETIGDIIGKYAGWNIAGVVALNQYLPGLFASHELPGTNVTPKLTDTIVTLAQTLNITPQAFVQQFQGQADILRPRALLLCPPLQTSAGATLTTMAQIYNLASPLAVAQANSALLRLLQTPQTLSYTYTAPDGTAIQKDYSIGANNTLATVVAQFNLLFSGLTTLTLDDMVDQNPAIVLAPNQIILAPPSPAMLPPLAVTLLDGYPDPIFPLTVNLQMLRNQQWVDPDFKNDTSVFFNSASVTASPLAAGAAPLSLSQFATNFENAFGGFKLGTGEAEGEGASSKPRLWVVNLDSKRGGIKFSADASKVKFFALEPLWNQLWRADKVTIPTYTSGQALEFDQVQDFQNVDLDSWLSTLLGAVDLVLSPQYSVPAFGLSTLAQSLLSEILEAKEDLAKGLRGLVNSLLSGATGDLDDAQEALYQQALTALSSVYSTNVIVQFPFTVTSTYTNASTAPLLSGKAVIKPYVSDGTVTNSTLVSHQLAAGDTFVSIANRFGITVIELVTANKDVANVFQPASSVTVLVNGKPVAVTADNGDTLSKITEKIYGGAADLEQLAVALWTVDLTGGKGDCGYTLCTTPPLGEQPTVLEYLELLPVASFSTAKLPLSQGESAVTFLLAVKNPEQRRMAFFDLDYAVNKLEYNVQLPPVPMASGVASNYAESSWLTFINPLDAVNFGQLQVPIPLRAFPSLPVLSQQSAVPSDPGSSDLVKAKQWNYEFVLNNQVAAQDSMELGAFFNITGSQAPVPPIQQGPSKKANQGLYQALAQFMAVQAAVMSDLTLLTSDPADSAVIAALQALHDLVKNVTTAWFAPAPAFKGAQEEPGESHWYALDTIINEQVDNQFQYLMLTNDLGNPLWPKINGNQYALQIGDEALYDYTEPISSPLDLRFAIDDLDAIQRQNGWSGALVVRNQNLLGVATVQTNPDFVYQTLLTLFSNKITPYLLIDAYAPLSPGAGNDPVSQLARALAAFFTVLFNLDTDPPKNSFQIRAQARYAFSLVTATAEVARHPGLGMVDEKSIMTSIPLVLNPLATFDPAKDADPTKPTSFVSQFATATISGAQGAGVAGSNGGTLVPGVYLFDFSVYSSLPTGTGTTALSKPILDIRNRYWEGPQ
jgi:LysM repeat protein